MKYTRVLPNLRERALDAQCPVCGSYNVQRSLIRPVKGNSLVCVNNNCGASWNQLGTAVRTLDDRQS